MPSSTIKFYSNSYRRLSRSRSGCHGLHVDTGRWENNVYIDSKRKLYLFCKSSQRVEDEHYFRFDCPLEICTVILEPDICMQILFSKLRLCQTFLLGVNQTHVVASSGAGFAIGAVFD